MVQSFGLLCDSSHLLRCFLSLLWKLVVARRSAISPECQVAAWWVEGVLLALRAGSWRPPPWLLLPCQVTILKTPLVLPLHFRSTPWEGTRCGRWRQNRGGPSHRKFGQERHCCDIGGNAGARQRENSWQKGRLSWLDNFFMKKWGCLNYSFNLGLANLDACNIYFVIMVVARGKLVPGFFHRS